MCVCVLRRVSCEVCMGALLDASCLAMLHVCGGVVCG